MISAPSYLRALLKPLNLAAYLTWLAILVDLLQASRSDFAGQPQTSMILMLAFLVAFSARDLLDQNRSSWRHRLLIALQALFAISLCALWRNDSAAPVLTVIVVAQCAMVLSLPALIGAVVMINLGLLYVFAVVRGLNHAWMEWLIYGGFQSFAALTAWYARSARESAEALQLTNAHLLATRCLLEESARDQERLRLARELHDVAGHKLTALKLNLSLLQLDRSAESGAALAVSARLAHELLDDLRAVVTQLRMHDGIDVRHALAQLVEPLPRPQVHLDLADDARVSNVAQAEALIRAAQEAITNIARHSNAQHAWLSLRRDSHAICLHVHDDGCGNPQLQEGHGLKGMRERLAALGGSLQISHASAGGLAVDVTIPLG
jgi:signal transduction histidine kinase